ncbi:MAG: hypothetical protein WC539_07480 [Nitrospirota bacterium]
MTTYKQNKTTQIKRDVAILKFLAAGIATKSHLHNTIFFENGVLAKRQVIERRLNALLKNKYIDMQRYKSIKSNKNVPVYCLAIRGLYEICRISNENFIEQDYIRTGFPPPPKLIHELVLSEIVRTVWREAEQKKYDLIHIYDDQQMKRIKKPQKNVYYPDLHGCLITHKKEKFTFNIELDCGNKGQAYWCKKIKCWEETTYLIALNRRRLEQLIVYTQKLNLGRQTAFALAKDFCRCGFSDTVWFWLPKKTNALMRL